MKSDRPASTGRKRGFWRTCRVYFRRFRIAVWLLVLLLLGALLYLNQVGLPDFAKKPLLDSLRARGVDLQFSRLRLSWDHGIVAEDVRFGQADDILSPRLTLSQVQVRPSLRALARLRLQINSLILRRGRLVCPLSDTNKPPRQLALEDIQAVLRFLPGDEWSLERFTAGFAGAKIQLSGSVTNASAVRDWKLFQAEQTAPVGVWRDRLRRFADLLDGIRFSVPPEFKLDVRGDARDLASFGVRLLLSTPGAETPWGSVAQGRLSARLLPANTNGLSSAELNLEAGRAQTQWAIATNLQFTAHLNSFESLTNLGQGDLVLCAGHVRTEWGSGANLQLSVHGAAVAGRTNLISAELALSAGRFETPWGRATNAQLHAHWLHALTNAVPLSGAATLQCAQAHTEWAAARELRLNVRLAAPPAVAPARADDSWAWWARLEPYALDWDCQSKGLQSRGVEAGECACAGSWRAPDLVITNLHAEFDQRHLDVRLALDVATRALKLSLASDADPHKIAPLLTEGAQRWLAPYAWEQPPELKGDLSLVLPAWTNRQPDWRGEVQPTLQLQGEFNLNHGASFRGVPVTSASSHIQYSNMVWRLPDLRVARPEGQLQAAHEADDRTKDYYFQLHSTLDLRILRPLLDAGQQRGLDYFTFTNPPAIDVELWGRWHEPDRIGCRGQVALTKFTFRGQSASSLRTDLQYTNRLLQFTRIRFQRGAQQATADGITADFLAQRIYLTNGYSTAEPMVVARAIGPNVARAIEAYQFKQPPVARVQGIIPMHGEDDADLHFDLDGGPFEWWRFHVPHLAGHVHWKGQELTLSDVRLDFYGGKAAGAARFHFHPGPDTDYEFSVTTTNSLLQLLAADLFARTNHLEGTLGGTLVITNASTGSLRSWNGRGDLSLRDGLIWEIPLFGIFSSVLNGMVPGLGSSRASAGTCTFGITNGVVRSDNLDIRSTGMRLLYRGTLDFQGQVNARVEAEPLRDIWGIGPVVSGALWPVTKLFEYKVTGSLGDPKGEPVYLLPKVFLLPFQMPFHPLRTLRNLFPEDLGVARTNSAPLTSPKQN